MKLLASSPLFLVLVLATIDPPTAAQPSPIPITKCGQVLDQPGEYVLTGALDRIECPPYTCSAAGGAITITASNVRVDTAGHGVNAICAAMAIADGLNDVRIDGGGWLSGGSGLIIGNDTRIHVIGLTGIRGDPDLGSTETGVDIRGADHVTISNNSIEGVYGIHGEVDDSVFENNRITGLGIVNYDIVLSGPNNVIRYNSIN